jgi:hypothetical protein
MRLGQLKFAFALVLGTACASCQETGVLLQTGKIDNPKITESSGVVASRQYTNVLWTHNDGGKSDLLFAISREGKTLAEFKVLGANFDDWEDIAIDNERHLYLADTGDNARKRKHVDIFQVDEPNPTSGGGSVQSTKRWRLRWPKGPVDCESLFVYQTNGYVVTKVTDDRKAEVYRFALDASGEQVLEFFARLSIDSPVTAADVAANGAAVAMVTKNGAFVYRVDGDMTKLRLVRPDHTRFKHDSMEACTFVTDGLLATAESREIFLFTAPPFCVLR